MQTVIHHKAKWNQSHHETQGSSVSQGCSPVLAWDPLETHSPVVRHDKLGFLMWLAAYFRLRLHQFDFNTAYLNSTFSQRLYIKSTRKLRP